MRTMIAASLLALAVAGTTYAADDSANKAAKKTSDGMGNLLKGMGQEVKKTGVGKDDKKAAKTGNGKDKK